MVNKTNVDGLPLSWSHFVALAKMADAEQRQRLMTQALENGWPVSQLEARISGKVPFSAEVFLGSPTQPTGGANQSEIPQPKVPTALVVGLQSYATQIVTLRNNLDRFGTRLDHLIHDAHPTDLSGTVPDQLRQARALLDALYRSNTERLDAWIAHVEEIGKLPGRPQDEWEEGPADEPKEQPPEEHQSHVEDALAATT